MSLNQKEQIRGFAIWWTILIIVVILVVGIVVFSFLFPRGEESEQAGAPTDEAPPLYTTPEPPERPELVVDYLDSCTGTILEVKDNVISFKADKESNPFSEDRNFQITVTEETTIIPFVEGMVLRLESAENKVEFESESQEESVGSMGISDLKAGDDLIVVASEDILPLDAFTAKKIFYFKK